MNEQLTEPEPDTTIEEGGKFVPRKDGSFELMTKEELEKDKEFFGLCIEVAEKVTQGRILFRAGFKPPHGKTVIGKTYGPAGNRTDEFRYYESLKTFKDVDYIKWNSPFGHSSPHENIVNIYKKPIRKGKPTKDRKGNMIGKEGDFFTLEDFNKQENEANQKIYSLFIDYLKLVPKDYPDQRRMHCSLEILLEENLAKKILNGITENPDNIWQVIDTIIPGLSQAWPQIMNYPKKMPLIFTKRMTISQYTRQKR